MSVFARQSKVFWWATVSAALMIVGSFGPWARVLFISVSVVDGDGWFVVIAAVAAGVMLYVYARRSGRSRWPAAVAALGGAAGLLVVIIDGDDIFGHQGSGDSESLFGDSDLVEPGWGIIMAGLASISLIVAAITLAVRTQVRHVAPEPTNRAIRHLPPIV